MKSKFESLRAELTSNWSELREAEHGRSELGQELVSVRKELNRALDRASKNDAVIVDLTERIALLQHEV